LASKLASILETSDFCLETYHSPPSEEGGKEGVTPYEGFGAATGEEHLEEMGAAVDGDRFDVVQSDLE
jgi:hypothetical protein